MASTIATPKTNREGLAALDEALQAGAATLQRLEEQGEQLHQTEIVADSNKYLLDRSAREIRGMTWSGWLQNQFTSGPAVPKPPQHRREPRSRPSRSATYRSRLVAPRSRINMLRIYQHN